MKRRIRDKDFWMLLIGAVGILALISVIISTHQQQNTLPTYTLAESDRVAYQSQAESVEAVAMQIYTDNDLNFSIKIPQEWTQVNQDGYPTFVDRTTGTSLQIQVENYYPSVNTVSSETASASLASEGMSFVGYTRTDDTSYELLYQDSSTVIYDYIEEVCWDRDHVITLLAICPDQAYSDMSYTYGLIFDSFTWNQGNPVTDGYALTYLSDIACEIGLPDTWVTGVSNNTFFSMNEDSTATMTLQAEVNAIDLSTVTTTDIASLLNSAISGYVMQSFTTSENALQAKAYYIQDNVQMNYDIYMVTQGGYLYTMTFSYESGVIDDSLPDTCVSMFRSFKEEAVSFAVEAPETESTSELPESIMESVPEITEDITESVEENTEASIVNDAEAP